jgi:hypothetical protein
MSAKKAEPVELRFLKRSKQFFRNHLKVQKYTFANGVEQVLPVRRVRTGPEGVTIFVPADLVESMSWKTS